MHEETVKISNCCKREVTVYGDNEDQFMCSRCGLACKVTEVCSDCFGTKEVSTDVDDGEGHTMRGVGSEPCRRCVISKRNANSL